MARYKLVKDEDGNTTGVVINDGTHPELPEGASIPNAADNRHWVEYEAWEAEPENDADAADAIDWMARLRSDRDTKLAAIDWRIMRNKTQLDNSDTPSDDATKMGEVRDYMQTLRDFPANNPITDKAGYEALSWPSEPA
jgi:hypothetical protein